MTEKILTDSFEHEGKCYETLVHQTGQGVEVGTYLNGELVSMSYMITWDAHAEHTEPLERAIPVLVQFAKQEITGPI